MNDALASLAVVINGRHGAAGTKTLPRAAAQALRPQG